MLRILLSICFLVPLVGCTAFKLDEQYSFNSDNERSLLIIKEAPANQKAGIIFAQLDLSERKFTDVKANFLICGGLCDSISNFGTSKLQDEQPDFFLKPVPAGEYAIMSRWTSGYRSLTTTCFANGTFVFDLAPGKVNLIVLDRLANAEEALHKLKDLIAAYPNIKGEVILAKPIAQIAFTPGKTIFGEKQCTPNTEERPIKIIKRYYGSRIEANNSQQDFNLN